MADRLFQQSWGTAFNNKCSTLLIYFTEVIILRNRFKKHKSHLLYSMNLNSRKVFFSLFIITFTSVSFATYKVIEKSLAPVVKSIAVSNADTYSTRVINDTVSKTAGKNLNYASLCKIDKDQNGNILSIEMNSDKINTIKQQTVDRLIKYVDSKISDDIYIPIGNLTGNYFFYGKGPKIPVRILLTGTPKVDFKSEFSSAGINQTKHTIYIITDVNYDVILPNEVVKSSVSTNTILTETVIVGKIPNVYLSK